MYEISKYSILKWNKQTEIYNKKMHLLKLHFHFEVFALDFRFWFKPSHFGSKVYV